MFFRKNMFKNKLTLYTYIGIAVLLLLQVYISSIRSSDGDRITDLDSKINRLNSQNRELQAQIYLHTSIASIQDFAQSRHMVPAVIENLGSVTVASLFTKP